MTEDEPDERFAMELGSITYMQNHSQMKEKDYIIKEYRCCPRICENHLASYKTKSNMSKSLTKLLHTRQFTYDSSQAQTRNIAEPHQNLSTTPPLPCIPFHASSSSLQNLTVHLLHQSPSLLGRFGNQSRLICNEFRSVSNKKKFNQKGKKNEFRDWMMQIVVFLRDNQDDFILEENEDFLDEQQAEPINMLEPRKGMMFDNEDDAMMFYKGYAKKKRFGVIRTTRNGEDNKIKYFTLACSRQGKAQYSLKNLFKPNPSTRMQCPCKINFCRRGEKFSITSVTLDHNHPTSPSKSRFLRCHKKLDLDAKRRLELNDQAGIRMNKNFGSLVTQAGGYEKLEFGEKECRNYLQETRRLKLGAGDAHAVYQYFLRMQSKDPDFFHLMDVAEDGRLRNVFWADARSRATYESYSDVITFDTTYLTNKYSMPFAPFVGVNHHGESVLLGCGLLSNEDTETFVWLFKSWLCCMLNKPPSAIITD
uniref:Uncharacterized protein n=1 Tax=Avena sativa TaxID=4498 RepID=A0ACD5XZL2_AVESA